MSNHPGHQQQGTRTAASTVLHIAAANEQQAATSDHHHRQLPPSTHSCLCKQLGTAGDKPQPTVGARYVLVGSRPSAATKYPTLQPETCTCSRGQTGGCKAAAPHHLLPCHYAEVLVSRKETITGCKQRVQHAAARPKAAKGIAS
jgi:hypothetical protein